MRLNVEEVAMHQRSRERRDGVFPASDEARANKRFLRQLTAIATLGALLFGFDTGVISGALIYLREDLQLTSVAEGLVVASLLFPGATSGALLGGPIADRFGRRASLISCAVLFAVGVLACSLAPDVATLVVARVVLGFAVGCASVACPLYLAELAPSNKRGRMVAVNQLMITVGLFLSFSSNVLFDQFAHGPAVWRYMIGIAIIPAIAFFLGMLSLPDTPRWYAGKGRLEHCRETLARAHSAEDAEFEYRQIVEIAQRETNEATSLWTMLRVLGEQAWMRRLLWIGIVLAVAQQTTGINVVMYYAPTVLEESGMTGSASLVASLAVGLEQVLLTFVGIWLLGFMGRRKMMLFGFFGVAVSHGLLAMSYLLPESTLRSYLILLFMVGVSASMVTFVGSTGFVVLSEIFPLAIRGFAMGASICGLWVANSLISFFFPILAEGVGSVAVFVGFAGLNLLVWLFVFRAIPETKGRTLEELEADFRSGRKD